MEINGTTSKVETITCGLPHRSILGPVLLLIYVNDILSAVQCKTLLYVDTPALILSSTCTEAIQDTLSSELESIRYFPSIYGKRSPYRSAPNGNYVNVTPFRSSLLAIN